MNSVQEARQALALSTKRGVPLILAGLLFWVVVGLCGLSLLRRSPFPLYFWFAS